MKKTLLAISAITLLIACGGGSEKKAETEQPATTKTVDITADPDYQKGLELTAKSDCFTCHKIDEKNIGPAWRDVANKYAGVDTAIKYLAHKIQMGGSGVWGEVPMAPHPTMSDEDAKIIAHYVLLLKNKPE
jgi:cytochrome c